MSRILLIRLAALGTSRLHLSIESIESTSNLVRLPLESLADLEQVVLPGFELAADRSRNKLRQELEL